MKLKELLKTFMIISNSKKAYDAIFTQLQVSENYSHLLKCV